MNFQNAPIQYQRHRPQTGYVSGVDDETATETVEFDILKVFRVISKHSTLIVIFLVLGLVSGLIFNLVQPVQYLAQAKIEIGTTGTKLINDLEASHPINDTRAYETARQKILTRNLSNEVVVKLGLTRNALFTEQQEEPLAENVSETKAVSMVQENLSATILRNTHIIVIGFTHPDKDIAAAIVNTAADAFINQNITSNIEASKSAHSFLTEQVALAKERLRHSDQTLLEYAKAEGITLTDNENSLVSKSISDMNTALSEAVRERLSAERFVNQVKAGNAKALPDVFESRPIQITKQRIAELRSSYQEKLNTLKPGFPEMKRLHAQINELEKQVNLEIDTIATATKIKLQQAVTNETALRNELGRLEKDQSDFRDKSIQYLILKREVDSNRAQYEALIDKLNDIGVSAQLNISNASIIEQALPPDHPIAPSLPLNLLTSFAIFSTLAAVSIALLELTDNRFSSAEQVETVLQIPTLAQIPISSKQDMKYELEDPSSSISEAYRNLRTSLLFTAAEVPIRSIAVTSPGMSDGKTTTCYALARDFAALGKNVLVIDADLRKPALHKIFHMPNRVGLSNLLGNVMGRQHILELFQQTDNPNVTILTAGKVPPNPADLLASEKMALTLHYASKKYDLLIIDCPPVLGLSDAPIVSRLADATMLVISQQFTLRKPASKAVEQLRTAGANLVGTVITRCNQQEQVASYAYGYASNGLNTLGLKSDTYLLEGDEPTFDWEAHKQTLMSPPYEKSVL